MLPLSTFQDYLSDWADVTAETDQPSDFFVEPAEPSSHPILSLDPGLTTPIVIEEATHSSTKVVLPSLSSHGFESFLVHNEPQAEPSTVVAPVHRSGSVTSTVPDKTAGHISEALGARPRVPLQEARVSSSDGEPVTMLTNTEIQIKNEGGDIIIILSPETDDSLSTSSDITALRRELLSLIHI